MSKITFQSQDVVAETLLIALYARALEAQPPAPLVKDDKAVALVKQIGVDRYSEDAIGAINVARQVLGL